MRVTRDQLHADWACGDLRFEVGSGHAQGLNGIRISTEHTAADLAGLRVEQRDEAWRRYLLILPLTKLSPKERSRRAIETYAEDLPSPGATRASLERWLGAFVRGGYDICKESHLLLGDPRLHGSRITVIAPIASRFLPPNLRLVEVIAFLLPIPIRRRKARAGSSHLSTPRRRR